MSKIVTNIGIRKRECSFGEVGSVEVDGEKHAVDVRILSKNRVSILIDGKSFYAAVESAGLKYDVLLAGRVIRVSIESPAKLIQSRLGRLSTFKSATSEVRSPMPGMVVRCEVAEGEEIKIGDGLLVLEAMKMENEIRATANGVVKKIFVVEKQVVDKGELLLLME